MIGCSIIKKLNSCNPINIMSCCSNKIVIHHLVNLIINMVTTICPLILVNLVKKNYWLKKLHCVCGGDFPLQIIGRSQLKLSRHTQGKTPFKSEAPIWYQPKTLEPENQYLIERKFKRLLVCVMFFMVIISEPLPH